MLVARMWFVNAMPRVVCMAVRLTRTLAEALLAEILRIVLLTTGTGAAT